MKIKGRVKGVRSKPINADKADITFKIETEFDQAVSDEADDLCPDDCIITLVAGLDCNARLVHVESDTNNRVVPSPDGSTRTVDRKKVLTLSFTMAHSKTLYQSMWGADGTEYEEIHIRQYQPDMFEGAGHQVIAERADGTNDAGSETTGAESQTEGAPGETTAAEGETVPPSKDPLEDVGYERKPGRGRRGMAVVEGGTA